MACAVLVTGATGFVGSHVMRALRGAGHRVLALVRAEARARWTQEPVGVDVVEGDLARPDSLTVLGSLDFDVVCHLAGRMPQRSERENAIEPMWSGNVETTRHLVNALPNAVRHIVYASSIDVYRPVGGSFLTEDQPADPTTAYGRSKLVTESLLSQACGGAGMGLTVLRLAQVFGPGEQPIKAIPSFIARIAAGQVPTIYGDGSELRSFVYVEDAAQAFVRAVAAQCLGTFNIAGPPVSIADALATIVDVSGRAIAADRRERAKPKVDVCIDTAAARDTLGFVAPTPFRQGIERQYLWWQANHRKQDEPTP